VCQSAERQSTEIQESQLTNRLAPKRKVSLHSCTVLT
jgi:hypothetical protein